MEDEKKKQDLISPYEEHFSDDVQSDCDAEETAISETGHHSEDPELPVEGDLPEASHCIDAESSSAEADTPPVGADYIKQIDGRLDSIASVEQRLFSEVREMHKLYHSEFAGRLKSMQDELEQYRKIDKGRAYDDILAEIARIYVNNETLADEVEEPKAKKNIRYMLLDIEDLLGVYGMSKLCSTPGEKRNPRHCQVLNRITTDDPAKHDTVAKSYNSGFYIGNRTIIKEVVDIFIYEGRVPLDEDETEEQQIIEAGQEPVAE